MSEGNVFRDYLYRLWADVVEKLGGVESTFTPLTGDPTSFKVMFSETMKLQPEGHTLTWVQEKNIVYSFYDLPREAVVGEIFTIDGTDHEVCAVAENNGCVIKVVVRER